MEDLAGNGIQRIEVDFDGDGGTDFTTTDPAASIQYTYNSPGTYLAKVRVTDRLNSVRNHTLVIAVHDPVQMDQLFNGLWAGMNEALTTRDVTTAAKFLNEGAKQKYQPVFEVLAPHMPEIIASYSPLRRVSISENIGEYAINRTINGKDRIFFIYFLKDVDGVWRVDAM